MEIEQDDTALLAVVVCTYVVPLLHDAVMSSDAQRLL